jgi:hypothetical protein
MVHHEHAHLLLNGLNHSEEGDFVFRRSITVDDLPALKEMQVSVVTRLSRRRLWW